MAFLHCLLVFFVSLAIFLHRRRSLPITNWPVLGMTPHLLLNAHRLHDFATHLLTLNHGTFLFKGPWFANLDMLVTSDPANIHHVLSKNFTNYPKGPHFRNIFDILGDGIFNSDFQLWEFHRTTTMSLLKRPDFHARLEITIWNKVEKSLLPLLDFVSHQEKETDLQDVFQRFAFDAICLLLLDYDPESLSLHLPSIPCEKAFTDVEEALLWRHVLPESVWKLQQRLGMGKEKKIIESCKAFDEFIYKCLSDKENELSTMGRPPIEEEAGLLASLMRGFKGQTGTSGDPRKFLKDTILNLMIAGRDTTSTALSWFFYLLAQNPRVATKIREEIGKQLGGGRWKRLGAKELGELLYLHGGLCEALRLFPPVALEHKSPSEADVLPSGHEVERHSKIILSLYSMGRMEWIWGEDCMEFRPERWFSRGGKSGIKHEPSYKFTAFNAGPRTCVGKEMAMTEMKMVAAAIIYHYNVELVEGHQITPSDSIILQMKYGLKVRLFRINQGL